MDELHESPISKVCFQNPEFAPVFLLPEFPMAFPQAGAYVLAHEKVLPLGSRVHVLLFLFSDGSERR
jgi:hypothetical protein